MAESQPTTIVPNVTFYIVQYGSANKKQYMIKKHIYEHKRWHISKQEKVLVQYVYEMRVMLKCHQGEIWLVPLVQYEMESGRCHQVKLWLVSLEILEIMENGAW